MTINIYSYFLYWEQKFLVQFMQAPYFFFVVILFAPLHFCLPVSNFSSLCGWYFKTLKIIFSKQGLCLPIFRIFFFLKYPDKFSSPQMLQYLTKFCQLFREKSCVLNSSTSFLRQGIKFCHNDGSLVIIRKICCFYLVTALYVNDEVSSL